MTERENRVSEDKWVHELTSASLDSQGHSHKTFMFYFSVKKIFTSQGSDLVQGTKTKTGNEIHFD